MKKNLIKQWIKMTLVTILAIFRFYKRQTPVVIICSMRSGSTLLKALLAESPKISHLPEVDSKNYILGVTWRYKGLSGKPIVVMKNPGYFSETDYPNIPKTLNLKKIILIRDAFETISSIKNMLEKTGKGKGMADEQLIAYWSALYQRTIHHPFLQSNTLILKYEDLLKNPVVHTKAIFEFLGDNETEGVFEYHPQKRYKWEWGSDDGGEKINGLKVVEENNVRKDASLIRKIEQSETAMTIRRHFGYID